MSDINTIIIAVFIMIPIALITKKLLSRFDNIEDDNKNKPE